MRVRSLLIGALLTGSAWAWTDGYFLDESIPVGLEENLERERMVGRGVAQHQVYQWEQPWFTNWVRVDRSDEGLRWQAVKGQGRVEGRQWISEMAVETADEEWIPIAAINGDFWAAGGRPVGLCVIGDLDHGRLLTLGNGRPAVAQTEDGALHMGRFHFEVELEVEAAPSPPGPLSREGREGVTEGIEIEIDDINIPADRFGDRDDGNPPSRTIAYTAESMTPDLPAWPPARLEASMEWAAVGLFNEEGAGLNINTELGGELIAVDETAIADGWPDGLVVLVGYGGAAETIASLPVGGRAEFEIECAEFTEPTLWALGGGPVLVHDGEVVVSPEGEPGFSASFTTNYHPRSVIGWNDDELILMVIDGRQPGLSRGMSLPECAEWMVSQGMTEAMNFDGGGSSSLWVSDTTESSPSDAGGERAVTDGLVLLTNARWAQVEPFGQVSLAEFAELTWSMHPQELELVVGESVALRPRAHGPDGERVRVPRDLVDLVGGPPTLAEVARDGRDRLTITGMSEGRGAIEISTSLLADESAMLASFPVTVGHLEHHGVDSLETEDPLPPLTLTRFASPETYISWETETVREGKRALALDYAMERGGTSAAYFDLDLPLPDEARRLTLWVHGDGGAGWLRGVATDADGEKFLLDFTNGSRGIDWEGWQIVQAGLTDLRPHWDNPEARADAPFTLATLYLAQAREASKTSGRVVFDDIGVEVFSTE